MVAKLERSKCWGSRLIRTVWIAAFGLAVLGGLFATRVTASMPSTDETVLDPATIGTNLVQDTLTKADKLDLTYLNPLAETIPVLPTKPIEVLQTKPRANANGSSQRLSNPNANRIAVTLPKPRPKIRLAKNNVAAKAAFGFKNCPQPDGLTGILMSFAGSLRCGG
jgi:hypothetical protein